MQRFLSMLGSPQKRLPPVIHVAGTNGKGSLLAYLQTILEAAGYTAHRYTSPHLVEFRERIMLHGKPIENAYLQTLLKHVAAVLPQQPATFFEATTALAFLAFSEKPADILLLETGMGGRLDATNVIDKPLLTAITPISLDHMEYLGDTIAKIAGEKAGIIKRGVPCVVGRQIGRRCKSSPAQGGKTGRAALSLWGMNGNCMAKERAFTNRAKRTLALHPSLAGASSIRQCGNRRCLHRTAATIFHQRCAYRPGIGVSRVAGAAAAAGAGVCRDTPRGYGAVARRRP